MLPASAPQAFAAFPNLTLSSLHLGPDRNLIAGLVAELVGTVLLAIPFIRGDAQPRWVGYLLVASALMTVGGDFIIAPNGPAANLAVNLLSNLGPVLLVIAVGYLGSRMWSE